MLDVARDRYQKSTQQFFKKEKMHFLADGGQTFSPQPPLRIVHFKKDFGNLLLDEICLKGVQGYV